MRGKYGAGSLSLLPHDKDHEMTDDEVQVWIGKPVRVTLTDASIVAGTLHGEDGHGHGHKHYIVVSDPIKKGDDKVKVLIHGAELITDIEDASDDPAAVE
jgi:hypothetical protein